MAELKAIDFFCSIGGMTYGFRKAGIDVIAGIDIDPSCKDTYEYNNPCYESNVYEIFWNI